jgi:acyl carrier protein
VVNSTGDLHQRIAEWVELSSARAPDRLGTAHPRPQLKNPYVEPEGEIEGQLAAIWQDLLGIEPVGRHDSFFDLGGHSLLATQVFSRVREVHHIELPLRSLFERPTVAELAALIETAVWARQGQQPVSAVEDEEREEIEL